MTLTQKPATMALVELPSSSSLFTELQTMIDNDTNREHTSWLFSNGGQIYLINYGLLKYWAAQDNKRICITMMLTLHLGRFQTDPEFISIKKV